MLFDRLYPYVENTYYQKDLHPGLWDGEDSFNSNIRAKLLKIVSDFIAETSVTTDIIDDIQLTGSLANYNYTKYSDIDLHILLKFNKLNDDDDLVRQALDGKRFIWNLRHSIVIKGHEVEVYFQDTDEPHIASGLYSVMNNKWIKQPTWSPPEIDERDVKKKATGIITTIKKLNEKIVEDIDPEEAEQLYNKGNLIKKKIKRMRQSGLEKDGEFSVENLAFKELRNSGAMEILINSITQAYDKIYSESTDEISVQEDMKSFKDMFEMPDSIKKFIGGNEVKKKGPRQQKWGTGGGRLHQNLVPDMHKVDGSLNHKVETLREKPAGKVILTQADINYIIPKYGMDKNEINTGLSKHNPKFLGTSGIMLYFDNQNNAYCLEK